MNDKIYFRKTSVEISRAEVLKMLSFDDFLQRQILYVLLVNSRDTKFKNGKKDCVDKKNGTFDMGWDGLARRCRTENTPEFRKQVAELSKTGLFTFEEVTRRLDFPKGSTVWEEVIFKVTFLTEEEQQSEDHKLTMDIDTTQKPVDRHQFESAITKPFS